MSAPKQISAKTSTTQKLVKGVALHINSLVSMQYEPSSKNVSKQISAQVF